ncbi:MAG TPA: hypothetical protein VKP30_05785 [Polyangiaceae bacterium]|nr:hypothetical protein [Polyangiaceae bacterium]
MPDSVHPGTFAAGAVTLVLPCFDASDRGAAASSRDAAEVIEVAALGLVLLDALDLPRATVGSAAVALVDV